MLEMIFAVTLFALIVVSLMGVWAMHARAVAHSRGTLIATHLAEMKMEEALSKGWLAQPQTSNTITAFRTETVVNGQKVDEVYDWTVDVTRQTTAEGGLCKLIQVKVTWQEQELKREVNLDTLITWQG